MRLALAQLKFTVGAFDQNFAKIDAIETICQLGLDPAVVIDAVRRINRSEYKRRQATPGLNISWKAFGVGRRYPVAADYQALIAGRTLTPEMSPP